MLNKGEGKARSLPELDMESVSGVSTRTEPTSHVESSACQAGRRSQRHLKLRQVQSEDLFATRELRDPPTNVSCCPQVCPQSTGEVVRNTRVAQVTAL